MTQEDIREMSFQNVLDHVLKPAGVQVGGYPEEIFTDLHEEEKEKWTCNICYLMLRDARECDNKHLFCHTCVFAWSLTYGENSQKCPMCRSHQTAYPPNKEVDKLLKDKRVKCPEPSCTFRSPLGVFLMHSHGRQRFVNDQVDLESLRPARPPGLTQQVIVLPGGIAMPGGIVRSANIREQLQQGRAMIHQMMLLLHLEMQLRQQALVSYSHAQDPDTRLRRLDEVLSLNEQLNEVGTILSALLSSPMASRAAEGRMPGQSTPNNRNTNQDPPSRRVDVSANVMMSRGAPSGPSPSTTSPPIREVLLSRGSTVDNRHVPIRQLRATPPSPSPEQDEDEEEEDDSSSDSETTSVSSVGSVVPRLRMSMNGQLNSPRDPQPSTSGGPLQSDLNRPLRRSEIRSHILETTSSYPTHSVNTPRSTRRAATNSSALNNSTDSEQDTGSLVTIQQLDRRNSRVEQNQTSTESSSSLPPLTNSNSVTRHNVTTRTRDNGSGTNASSSSSETFPISARSSQTGQGTGLSTGPGHIPRGSSMYQRIIQSMNNDSEDDEDDDGRSSTFDLSSNQRPNSVARLVPLNNVTRSFVVTSQGVTASGATFQTSADTPLTRGVSRQPPNNAQLPSRINLDVEEVTSSGAVVSVSADTPVTRAPAHLPQVPDTHMYTRPSEVARSERDNTNPVIPISELSPSVSRTSDTANSMEQRSEDDVFVSNNTNDRPLSRSYAPQRRFRRDINSQGSQSNSTVNRHSRSVTVPSSSQVPYVPHRTSVSPTRNIARNIRTRRSNSTSVDTGGSGRRLSFTRDDPTDSVVRMAARGGNSGPRNALPNTPGQLMRSRRRSDSRRPNQGPGGTI